MNESTKAKARWGDVEKQAVQGKGTDPALRAWRLVMPRKNAIASTTR